MKYFLTYPLLLAGISSYQAIIIEVSLLNERLAEMPMCGPISCLVGAPITFCGEGRRLVSSTLSDRVEVHLMVDSKWLKRIGLKCI